MKQMTAIDTCHVLFVTFCVFLQTSFTSNFPIVSTFSPQNLAILRLRCHRFPPLTNHLEGPSQLLSISLAQVKPYAGSCHVFGSDGTQQRGTLRLDIKNLDGHGS